MIVQSEKDRTPSYNTGNGKDHWSIGSILFLGSGIRGDRVVGSTDEKQFAVPLDPRTLTGDKDRGIRVRPEQIHQALRQLAGTADNQNSLKLPLGVKPAERFGGCGAER